MRCCRSNGRTIARGPSSGGQTPPCILPLQRHVTRVAVTSEFALSSSHFDSRSLHIANPEARPPPAPTAHALLRLAEHRVGGRWSRHIRGTPGQKPYRNPDSDRLSHGGSPPVRLKPTELRLRAHPRVAQSVRSVRRAGGYDLYLGSRPRSSTRFGVQSSQAYGSEEEWS